MNGKAVFSPKGGGNMVSFYELFSFISMITEIITLAFLIFNKKN